MKMKSFSIVLLFACFVAKAQSRRWATPSPSFTQYTSIHAPNPHFVQTTSITKRNRTTLNPASTSSIVTDVTAALTISQRLISGGCSRGIAQMILYPIDALRTLAQTRDGRTLADVGAKALIRGCVRTSSFAVFIGSIQFAIFGATREKCGPVLSSALGAAASCIISVPQEVIKQRLVTGVYSNFRSAVVTIWETEGISGFYCAWRPTMARNIPFVVTTFTAMDILKRKRISYKKEHYEKSGVDLNTNNEENILSLTVVENLLIGISSSLIGATLTHPADVIKTRMMTQAASKALPYTSTMDCINKIWKTEGIRSFYSGFAQRSAYMGPLWAMQFALNGKFNTAFQKFNSQSCSEVE